MFHKCRITAVKKEFNQDLVTRYSIDPDGFSMCSRVENNQEFIVSNPFEMPDGICPYAWADIRPMLLAIATGGTFDMMKNRHSTLAACTDLFRPVIFQIERME